MSFYVSDARQNGMRCRNRSYSVSLEGDTFFLTVERTGTTIIIR